MVAAKNAWPRLAILITPLPQLPHYPVTPFSITYPLTLLLNA